MQPHPQHNPVTKILDVLVYLNAHEYTPMHIDKNRYSEMCPTVFPVRSNTYFYPFTLFLPLRFSEPAHLQASQRVALVFFPDALSVSHVSLPIRNESHTECIELSPFAADTLLFPQNKG
jgi:hypothetical protein